MSESMLNLTYSCGKVMVWNADDWLKIREDHRIVGVLIGTLGHLPRQDVFLGLPMVLLPEEANLLLEKKVATLVSYPCLSEPPTLEVKKKFEEYRKRMYEEQVDCFKEERKRQVTSMIDRIVEGKRKKMMGGSNERKKKKGNRSTTETEDTTEVRSEEKGDEKSEVEIDRDALLKAELEKIKNIDESNTLIQTFTASPWITAEDAKPAEWNYPTTSKEKLQYKVFKDLWEKGYYITPGQKFGADFLVYLGDPIKFHSQFLVICLESNEPLSAAELVAMGRLAHSVRKTVALASLLKEDEIAVRYQSIQWREDLK